MNIEPRVLAAVIALIGVLLSLFISYITSLRNVKVELKKHQDQILQGFGQKLFEKRIDCYPKLYAIVARYVRDAREDRINVDSLKSFYNEIVDWDVNNSIYMSAKTHYLFHKFRLHLVNMLKKPEQEIVNQYKDNQNKKALKEKGEMLELYLKHELGIYSFESPTKVIPDREFKSYKQADEFAKKNS